jgi:flavodoxin
MKIGMIVYSHTGHTLSVAETLQKSLEKAGKTVCLEKIQIQPDHPNIEFPNLVHTPTIEGFDWIILGSPVHGFMPSKAITTYLNTFPDLTGRNILCFVTHYFPFACMGGTIAVHQIQDICLRKGAKVHAVGVIDWMNWHRKRQIQAWSDSVVKIVE